MWRDELRDGNGLLLPCTPASQQWFVLWVFCVFILTGYYFCVYLTYTCVIWSDLKSLKRHGLDQEKVVVMEQNIGQRSFLVFNSKEEETFLFIFIFWMEPSSSSSLTFCCHGTNALFMWCVFILTCALMHNMYVCMYLCVLGWEISLRTKNSIFWSVVLYCVRLFRALYFMAYFFPWFLFYFRMVLWLLEITMMVLHWMVGDYKMRLF